MDVDREDQDNNNDDRMEVEEDPSVGNADAKKISTYVLRNIIPANAMLPFRWCATWLCQKMPVPLLGPFRNRFFVLLFSVSRTLTDIVGWGIHAAE
jgi:hypothetical protein